jgi:hypothetical protein
VVYYATLLKTCIFQLLERNEENRFLFFFFFFSFFLCSLLKPLTKKRERQLGEILNTVKKTNVLSQCNSLFQNTDKRVVTNPRRSPADCCSTNRVITLPDPSLFTLLQARAPSPAHHSSSESLSSLQLARQLLGACQSR